MRYTTKLIQDHEDPRFMSAFQQYFEELGEEIPCWDDLLREMNDGKNASLLLTAPDGSVMGFIQFTPMVLENWFFTVPLGFIREFWVAPTHRRRGFGSLLLRGAEDYFRAKGIYRVILTSDTAQGFYLHQGYREDGGVQALNHIPVFVKDLQAE